MLFTDIERVVDRAQQMDGIMAIIGASLRNHHAVKPNLKGEVGSAACVFFSG